MIAPAPHYSSGCVADRLDADNRRIELFLKAGHDHLVKRAIRRINRSVGYLVANFPPAALERGPAPR